MNDDRPSAANLLDPPVPRLVRPERPRVMTLEQMATVAPVMPTEPVPDRFRRPPREDQALYVVSDAEPEVSVRTERIAGEKSIQPDDVTKTEIGRSGKAKIVASFKICLSATGSVNSVTKLKSSGFDAYDAKLQREMKSTWKYRPFMVNGKAAPVCTAVTFIYSQKS